MQLQQSSPNGKELKDIVAKLNSERNPFRPKFSNTNSVLRNKEQVIREAGSSESEACSELEKPNNDQIAREEKESENALSQDNE